MGSPLKGHIWKGTLLKYISVTIRDKTWYYFENNCSYKKICPWKKGPTVITTRKHSSRVRTDRTVTSDQVANKDEQWPSRHEADCGQNDRRVWKHYLHLRSVTRSLLVEVMDTNGTSWCRFTLSNSIPASKLAIDGSRHTHGGDAP